MTQDELNMILASDKYHIKRKEPGPAEIRLFLREVDYHCPLCGKDLQSRTQVKPTHKAFQIAHIYPNRPTVQQYTVLHNLERLGETSEDFENKIALCVACHNQQDYQTSKEDYEKLLSIKKKCLKKSALHDAVDGMYLENELKVIVDQISRIPAPELRALNMKPVQIAAKFEESDILVVSKITGYVTQYYTYIRDLFRELDGKNGFSFNAICCEIRAAYEKMAVLSKNKDEIFAQIASLIKRKTSTTSQTACEVLAAFFVQNCEVFNEITR